MLDRFNPALRILSIGLGMLLLYQVGRLALRKDPVGPLSFSGAASLLGSPEDTGKSTNAPAPPERGKKAAELPPPIQARVDRITQSEIFGPVIRPLPMALLGIAGKDVLLRAPNGQTGLLREGEELGGIKLLRIGTNRVLIEQEQQQKELTVFSGFGSESLLPKPKGKATPQ